MIGSIGFTVDIQAPTEAKFYTLTPRSVANAFDFAGGLLSLPRISGERNIDYKNRLFDVAVHPGGPLYEGVINGIGRALGFIREKTLLIDLKLGSDGDALVPNPRVDILANRIVLYSDWQSVDTYTVDREIRFYSPADEGYYLNGLADLINESSYFSASIYDGIRENMQSFLLVRGTSNKVVYRQPIRADNVTIFEYNRIIEGTLWFEEKDIFETEVETDPDADGEYYVDYTTGLVKSYNLPSGNNICGYKCAVFPMKVDSLPVQVFTLQDDDFKKELFVQETLGSGETINSLPTAEGAEILHQVYKEVKVFWGK